MTELPFNFKISLPILKISLFCANAQFECQNFFTLPQNPISEPKSFINVKNIEL